MTPVSPEIISACDVSIAVPMRQAVETPPIPAGGVDSTALLQGSRGKTVSRGSTGYGATFTSGHGQAGDAAGDAGDTGYHVYSMDAGPSDATSSPDGHRKRTGSYVPLYGEVEAPTCLQQTPNFVGSVANLANAAIGAGVLAFPFAFSVTGVVLGPLVAAAFGLVMWFSLHILGVATTRTGASSYQEAVKEVLGGTWERVMEVCMYLYLFGSCTAYLNIIGDQLTPLAVQWLGPHSLLADRHVIIGGFTLFVVMPLCLLRRIESLSFTSTLAVVSIIYMMLVLIVHAYQAGPSPKGYELFIWGSGVFQAIPIICFALQCHLVYIPQYQALTNPSQTKMDAVGILTMLICLAIYIPAGIAGYIQLGPDTPGDVLTPFGDEWDMTVGRICIASTAIFSYPLLQFVARTAADDLFFPNANIPTEGRRTPGELARYYGETFVFMAGTLALALAIPKIKTVLGFTGSTTAVMQVFVVPGLMWRTMRSSVWTGQVVGWLLVVFGVGIGVVSTVVIAVDLHKPS